MGWQQGVLKVICGGVLGYVWGMVRVRVKMPPVRCEIGLVHQMTRRRGMEDLEIYFLTLVGGAIWPAEDGCEVEDVVVAGGLEAKEGGRGVFVVLVELFDQAFGCHGVLFSLYINTGSMGLS